MATDAPKLEDLQDKDTAEAAAKEIADIDAAANREQDAPQRSPGEQAAEDAELKRQKAVVDAVAKANEKELPKLGGPLKEPGLGR
jgi:hypothetical protein